MRFQMLAPEGASYANPRLKTNAGSYALCIRSGGKDIVVAGDIEAAQEAALLHTDADRLLADVLLAPRHSSDTSSSAAFLQAGSPKVGIFQVGHRNRYPHPKKLAYACYGAMGIERIRTDERRTVTRAFGRGPDVTT